jgi:hypothetical protein
MGVTHPSNFYLSGKERGLHPFSFGERLDALRKAELDQFRAPQSYLLTEFLGVSLWVPPFSMMLPSYNE